MGAHRQLKTAVRRRKHYPAIGKLSGLRAKANNQDVGPTPISILGHRRRDADREQWRHAAYRFGVSRPTDAASALQTQAARLERCRKLHRYAVLDGAAFTLPLWTVVATLGGVAHNSSHFPGGVLAEALLAPPFIVALLVWRFSRGVYGAWVALGLRAGRNSGSLPCTRLLSGRALMT